MLCKFGTLDEERLTAQQNLELYRQRLPKNNERVRLRSFRKGGPSLGNTSPYDFDKEKGILEPD